MNEEIESTRLVRELTGIGLSGGLAIGTAYRLESPVPPVYRMNIAPDDVERELGRFQTALARSREQLEAVKQRFEAEVGREHSYIIDAHLLMLEDRGFLAEVTDRVGNDLESPEKALGAVADNWFGIYSSFEDPFFRERASDFQEVVERIITNLTELKSPDEQSLPNDLILVAPDLGLSMLASYPLEQVKGLVLTRAGKTSHLTIIARSYRIPVVSGIHRLDRKIRTGDVVVVDGDEGTVRVGVSVGELDRMQRRRQQSLDAGPTVDLEPCATSDGVRIRLYGNSELVDEASRALELGAEGIGLFRSEYTYLRQQLAGEDNAVEFDSYRGLAEVVGDRPAIIRTLDLSESDAAVNTGGRAGDEDNGALGLRGIRFSLKHPDLFRRQVQAIVRASRYGHLKIVLPMISSLEEVREARLHIVAVIEEQSHRDPLVAAPEIGVTVEVPATIPILDELAAESDFLAVGTNDLIQYLLAAGRRDEAVGYLHNPLHPAVLRTLQRVQQVAEAHGRMALVVGEAAAHPVHAAILVGLGYRHLSMNPRAIQQLKAILRKQSARELAGHVRVLLGLATIEEINAYVDEHFDAGPGGRGAGSRRVVSPGSAR